MADKMASDRTFERARSRQDQVPTSVEGGHLPLVLRLLASLHRVDVGTRPSETGDYDADPEVGGVQGRR